MSRAPSDPEISVIIPTRNRATILDRTLEGYQRQTLNPARFEVLVVDDGSTDTTPSVLENWSTKATFRLKHCFQENLGPGAARNRALRCAVGSVILFSGDDVVPSHDLLHHHVKGHRSERSRRRAILGQIRWHRDVVVTPLRYYVTMVSGSQFGYHMIRDPENVPYLFFYSSNVSLKRAFLPQEDLFRPEFRFAAFEDIELGYRLVQKGMRIRYTKDALAYHVHRFDLNQFCQRQFRSGMMAAVMDRMHPEIDDRRRVFAVKPENRSKEIRTLCRMLGLLQRAHSGSRLSIYEDRPYAEVPQELATPLFERYEVLLRGYFKLGYISEGNSPGAIRQAGAQIVT